MADAQGMRNHLRTHHRTRTPYDDVEGYDRYWGSLSIGDFHAASMADPIRFIADHVAAIDRREGAVVVLLDMGDGVNRSVHVLAESLPNAWVDECRMQLAPFAEVAGEFRSEGLLPSIGVIHHRRGEATVNELDLRWAGVVKSLAEAAGIMVIGVAARTESGALVRVCGEWSPLP